MVCLQRKCIRDPIASRNVLGTVSRTSTQQGPHDRYDPASIGAIGVGTPVCVDYLPWVNQCTGHSDGWGWWWWWRCPVHPVQSIDVLHSWTDLLFRASACSTYPGVCMMYRAHLYGSGRHYFTGSFLVVASIPPSQALLHRLSWYSTWLQFHWVVFLRYPHRLIHPTHDRLVKQCAFIQSDPHQRAIGPVHPMIPS